MNELDVCIIVNKVWIQSKRGMIDNDAIGIIPSLTHKGETLCI